MGQTHCAPSDEAMQFRQMVLATYYGDVEKLRKVYQLVLRDLQISRATYLDIWVQEKMRLETVLTDSLEREEKLNELQDEKMEFFAAVEKGKLVLGDTLLHVAVRLEHKQVLDFMLLTDYQDPLRTMTKPSAAQNPEKVGTISKNFAAVENIPPPLPTNTPNFKGKLPRDVVGNNCSLQLLLATIDDVHEVFGSSYRDEPKVHRLIRSLQRLWPLWMFEGQQEVAALVRVLYDTRTSDPAFGRLVRVAVIVAERFRMAVSRDGIRIAMSLLTEYDGDVHQVRQLVVTKWTTEHKIQELTRIFQRWFPLYKPNGKRKDCEEEGAHVAFFDTAMTTWLQVAQDLRLFGEQSNAKAGHLELPDTMQLERYKAQIWKRCMCPPSASIGSLCVHIDSLEGYLMLPHLIA